MSSAAAIGEHTRIAGYALAGVEVLVAENPPSALSAWEALPADVSLLIVTPMAEEALREQMVERPDLLRARLP